VPATFTIHRGGSLRPPRVTVPAFIAVQLTIASVDRRSDRVVLLLPRPRALTVAPGGRASVRLPGLKAGDYVIAVNGAARGDLLVGGEPGP
jgi:hypothetical protein